MDLENKENKCFLGIDPGKSGSFSLIDEEGKIIHMIKIPTIGKEYDVQMMAHQLEEWKPFVKHAVLENVHAIQGRVGNSSNFNFGLGKGILIGLLQGLGIRYTMVNPKAWQKEVWEGVSRQKDNKQTSLLAAKRLFPNETFIPSERARKPHDGMVDATLMAEYARRKFNV